MDVYELILYQSAAVACSTILAGGVVAWAFYRQEKRDALHVFEKARCLLASPNDNISPIDVSNTYRSLMDYGFFLPLEKRDEAKRMMSSLDEMLTPIMEEKVK